MAAPAKQADLAGAASEANERRRLITLLHVGRTELAIDDATWRAYLASAFCCSSSTELSIARLKTALAHLRRKGFVPKGSASGRAEHEWTFVDSANYTRAPLLRKIIMLMQSTGVARGQQVAYVEGVARQMGGYNPRSAGGFDKVHTPLAMCSPKQLQAIVAALAIHIKREQDRAAAHA